MHSSLFVTFTKLFLFPNEEPEDVLGCQSFARSRKGWQQRHFPSPFTGHWPPNPPSLTLPGRTAAAQPPPPPQPPYLGSFGSDRV